MSRVCICLLVVCCGVLAACPAVQADEVAIVNPGFEDPVLAEDDWNYSMDNQGWSFFANGGNQGSWNVTTGSYPGEAPEGKNIGWTNSGDACVRNRPT